MYVKYFVFPSQSEQKRKLIKKSSKMYFNVTPDRQDGGTFRLRQTCNLGWFKTAALTIVRTDSKATGIPLLVCVP